MVTVAVEALGCRWWAATSWFNPRAGISRTPKRIKVASSWIDTKFLILTLWRMSCDCFVVLKCLFIPIGRVINGQWPIELLRLALSLLLLWFFSGAINNPLKLLKASHCINLEGISFNLKRFLFWSQQSNKCQLEIVILYFQEISLKQSKWWFRMDNNCRAKWQLYWPCKNTTSKSKSGGRKIHKLGNCFE